VFTVFEQVSQDRDPTIWTRMRGLRLKSFLVFSKGGALSIRETILRKAVGYRGISRKVREKGSKNAGKSLQ